MHDEEAHSCCEVRHPQPPKRTAFACQACGTKRTAGPPFSVHQASKAIWCKKCQQGVRGGGGVCLCGK
eukprot:9035601-Karenia_brevis.AAC.1